MTTTEQRVFRLASTKMVHAPGMLRWAINGYKFKQDRKAMLKIMKAWPGPTDAQWDLVLSEKVPYTVEGNVVVLTFDE